MPQFIGKNAKKTSSDSKRHFTVVIDGKEHGLYVSSTPSSAARKAITKLCTVNKGKKVEFYMCEITQDSKKKTYGPYEEHIEKLNEPIELKGRIIKYKPVAKLSGKSGAKKKIMRGGEKTRDELKRVANKWIGHGTYARDENNISLIIENDYAQNNSEEYIPNDFIILFTNYGQFEPVKELYDFLFTYSSKRYEEKTLTMNCWQFVLLCLLESEYIDVKQLKKLYLNYDNNPNSDRRIPDYFSNEYSDNPESGDIILFQQKRDGIIWHVAILLAINIEDGVIEYIEILGEKVSKSKIIYNEEYSDNLLFIKPENLLKPISPNSVRNKIKSATYSKPKLKKFLVNIFFKDNISIYATQKWEDHVKSLPKPVNYEELFKELEPRQYKIIKNGKNLGINYTHGNENYYEKRCIELFKHNPEFKNDILHRHNLLRFV
jgi:hypothetical protein